MLEGVSFFWFDTAPSSFSTGTKEADHDREKTLCHIKFYRRKNTWWRSGGLGSPALGVLILAKAFIVVTLGSEELLEVGLAIENTLHGGVVSESKVTFAV
jgi:hypothetical protein